MFITVKRFPLNHINFLKFLEHSQKIKHPAQIHAWLVTTARRETLQYMRQQKKTPQVSLDVGDDNEFQREFASAEPLADEILLELERQHRVRTAVTALGARCRQFDKSAFLQRTSAALFGNCERAKHQRRKPQTDACAMPSAIARSFEQIILNLFPEIPMLKSLPIKSRAIWFYR